MADLGMIMRGEAVRYIQTHRTTFRQRKTICDIANCRTPAMGSVSNTCQDCDVPYRLYCSCRNRSCPLCQGEKRRDWLEARRQELLPVSYLQVIFGNPREFRLLARYCPAEFDAILFRAAGHAVIDVGRFELHVQLGCFGQFHTWTQLMDFHAHTHFVVPCGGFSEDGSRWIAFEPKDFPVRALRKRFRTLLCKYVREAVRAGKFDGLPPTVSVDQLVAKVQSRELKVHVAPPFGGPKQLLQYLTQYMYRVAITNDRIESYDQHQVTFRWRDYREGGKVRRFTVTPIEFVERFVPHIPPKGFVRVRSYGFLGNRNRKKNLEKARQLIGQAEARAQERPKPIRLCPPCYAARRGQSVFTMRHFALAPDLAPQVDLAPRSPPITPVVV